MRFVIIMALAISLAVAIHPHIKSDSLIAEFIVYWSLGSYVGYLVEDLLKCSETN